MNHSIIKVAVVSILLAAIIFLVFCVFSNMHKPAVSQTDSAVPMSVPDAYLAPTGPVDFTQNVTFVDQYPELPTGCESVALTTVLDSMGYDLETSEIADDYMPYSDWDFVNAFVGDPHSYEGMGIFSPGITVTANSFLGQNQSRFKAYDITGSSFNSFYSYIDQGYPVILWTTIDQDDPYFTGEEDDGWDWYENEHCVVLYGYDSDTDEVYVSDPTNGLVTRDASRFAELYEECGSMAVVIK